MLLDELLAWLTEAQALLHTKTKDPIPEDLTVVEALVREHLVGSVCVCVRACVYGCVRVQVCVCGCGCVCTGVCMNVYMCV